MPAAMLSIICLLFLNTLNGLKISSTTSSGTDKTPNVALPQAQLRVSADVIRDRDETASVTVLGTGEEEGISR
ncbi:hypothetical protein MATL_G00255360 [Megalops atlanticus]|uniref:Secreted protein n=1 Tax=Megalops atlanticus TaxID=7932 RepID=A0A9D3PA41_MEGAT|nr:hypothetical protein MATL_G00255360 [Megalops atlanticus]